MKNLTGQKFGHLTAIRPTGERQGTSVIWECECDCGNKAYVSARDLTSGKTRSCGCLKRETATKTMLERDSLVENTDLNILNKKLSNNNTSGIKGVSWDKNRQQWMAEIKFKGKNYHLGRFANIDDAAAARRKAEQQLFDPILKKYGRAPTVEQT